MTLDKKKGLRELLKARGPLLVPEKGPYFGHPGANPSAQSSSSAEATDALTSTIGFASRNTRGTTREMWCFKISRIRRWTNKDWLEKSRINYENRSKTSGKHRCGTKALAVRVDEETNNNGGQVPELAKVYKDVHFNPNTNKWIHHDDEATYETILKVQEDHC
nr:hypothetical protein CFP56_06995 [Quercus suber]